MYCTEKIAALLYGGVVAFKISLRFNNGQSFQRHTYYNSDGSVRVGAWIHSPITLERALEKNSGFHEE